MRANGTTVLAVSWVVEAQTTGARVWRGSTDKVGRGYIRSGPLVGIGGRTTSSVSWNSSCLSSSSLS
jgi:hypothetical protein